MVIPQKSEKTTTQVQTTNNNKYWQRHGLSETYTFLAKLNYANFLLENRLAVSQKVNRH